MCLLCLQKERFSGSRQKEPLVRYILEHAETSVAEVTSSDEWAALSSSAEHDSWLLLLCYSDTLPDCLYDDERTKLAASLVSLPHIVDVAYSIELTVTRRGLDSTNHRSHFSANYFQT